MSQETPNDPEVEPAAPAVREGEKAAAKAVSAAETDNLAFAENDDVVEFDHKLFSSMDGAFFRMSAHNPDEPVMIIDLGGTEVALPFDSLRREFRIEPDSSDDRMLNLVADGLGFVRVLRPGDPLPTEVLTGEPSADIPEKHRQIARYRISMQLVTWLTGDESLITDPAQLIQVAEDPATKKRVNDALLEAAKKLGLGPNGKDEVLSMIERLADDLAAVEMQRDVFASIKRMEEKTQQLRRIFARQQSVREVADPVARLTIVAREIFQEALEEIDAQTGEIIGVLKYIDAHVRYVRERRNLLHRRLMAWDAILSCWEAVKLEESTKNIDLLRRTYRFLAPRFMPVDEWVLLSKVQAPKGTEREMRTPQGENQSLAKTERRW